MSNHVLEVSNLKKKFSKVLAVDNLSFKLKKGEILGLLGPNGAGKTTTIHMLLGLTTPDSGFIKYFGSSFEKNRESCLSRINFASVYSEVQGRLTVRQNLKIFAGLYEVKNADERIKKLLKVLKIENLIDKLYWKLSSGQKTRVIIVKSLLNSPNLILMDEPTASLDPEIKNDVIDLIRDLQKKENVSILYTSHDMNEVSRICDRVMFLSHGKLVAVDTPLGLTKHIGKATLTITFDKNKKLVNSYLKQKRHKYRYIREHVVEINLSEERIPKVLFGLSNRGIWLTNIDIKKPDLEDVFLSIAKNEHK